MLPDWLVCSYINVSVSFHTEFVIVDMPKPKTRNFPAPRPPPSHNRRPQNSIRNQIWFIWYTNNFEQILIKLTMEFCLSQKFHKPDLYENTYYWELMIHYTKLRRKGEGNRIGPSLRTILYKVLKTTNTLRIKCKDLIKLSSRSNR